MRSRDPAVLVEQARAGDRGAAGRLLSLIERGGPAGRAAADLTFAAGAGLDLVVGVTGAPGAGKSTLTDRLVASMRATGRRVGVLAVDPSSPRSGGAILGDRVRMGAHTDDEGVFIRSMATRGHQGGLALAVPEVVRALGAIGFPTVVVETVGVGQVEVEVAGAADTAVVVVTPGWGDRVQAAKAGLLEVADVFVVNKADRDGAEHARADLEAMLDLDPEMGGWRPPVVLTVASRDRGVDQLWEVIEAHHRHQVATGALGRRRRRQLTEELQRLVLRRLTADLANLAGGRRWDEVVEAVTDHRMAPGAAADELLAGLRGPLPSPG